MPPWLARLLDLVWPDACAACGAAAPSPLCSACAATLVRALPDPCLQCHAPRTPAGRPCHRCRETPPAFATVHALGAYDPHAPESAALVRAIKTLKYDGRRPLATVLGALLATHYDFSPDALLVPVPLHLARLRERGFNQAALLAGVLGRRRGIDVCVDALARVRPTAPQAALDSAAARRGNLRAAIRVQRPARVRGRVIVLIDDVVTTGATADACAAVLRAAGAIRVDVYAVARTP